MEPGSASWCTAHPSEPGAINDPFTRRVTSAQVSRTHWETVRAVIDDAAAAASVRHAWSASDRYVPRTFVQPLQRFLDTEAAGGVVLIGRRSRPSSGPTAHLARAT